MQSKTDITVCILFFYSEAANQKRKGCDKGKNTK
jgi:hypothetical protein